MTKRAIGKTGVGVRAIGLGAMPLSIQGRPSEADGIRVFHAAFDAGTDFVDTADAYCLDDSDTGHNEVLIRKALRGRKEKIFVATKGGSVRPGGSWHRDGRPEHLRSACEHSLKCLGVERIFLYQLHAVDPRVPLADSVGELAKLQKEGKIAHIGLSNVSGAQLDAAQRIVRIESVQNRCHPGYREDLENGLVAQCGKQQVTYIAYSPVGGGYSHESVAKQTPFPKIAKKYGVSPYQVILAWLLTKGDNMLPIPGASRIESAVGSAKAADLELAKSDLAEIDSAA